MIVAQVMQLDHPSGISRMSTLTHDWTDPEGRTWIGGGGIVSISPRGPETAVDGGTFAVTWNGATAALIAEALHPSLLRAGFYVATVWLEDDGQTRIGDPVDEWRGLVETPDINADPAAPSITITVQSVLLDLGRARRVVMTPKAQQEIDPDDISANWVAMLADHDAGLEA